MKRKIVFLDIDGVITTSSTKYKYFDDRCVGLLTYAIYSSDSYIVISSSFRLDKSLDELKKLCDTGIILNDNTFKYNKQIIFPSERIIGLIPEITFTTPTGHKVNSIKRGEEISLWINDNKDTIDKYVVVDDDDFFIKPHTNHLVKVDPIHGFSSDNADLLISMFQ